jgi:hypothetical protein
MATFRDSAHAADFIGSFFRDEAVSGGKFFAGTGIIYAYVLTDLGVTVIIDASVKPQPGHNFNVFVNDPNAPKPTVEFIATADDFDRVYRGEAQPMALMMTGKIKTKGDVVAAMRTLPAMGVLIPHYKAYCAAHGR